MSISDVSMLTLRGKRGIIEWMNRDFQDFNNQIPSFQRREAYDFVDDRESLDIYNELSQISEEIEQCRLRNC